MAVGESAHDATKERDVIGPGDDRLSTGPSPKCDVVWTILWPWNSVNTCENSHRDGPGPLRELVHSEFSGGFSGDPETRRPQFWRAMFATIPWNCESISRISECAASAEQILDEDLRTRHGSPPAFVLIGLSRGLGRSADVDGSFATRSLLDYSSPRFVQLGETLRSCCEEVCVDRD
ncbi:hypothetical protein [Saccharopolyspora sp. 5N708]|uniref:hypothetical protein n=1 Tax=Saccharopolyspora sp. 5N708 TaxID=3457424 RepID=UPI003FD5E132